MHVNCRGMDIGLDHPSGEISFISHAHSDHMSGLKRKTQIIASSQTLALAQKTIVSLTHPHLRMIDAGHILGSRQLVVDGDGERTIYTGDFSIKPNIFGFSAEIEPCDHLIMEATYGDPQFVFPPAETVHDQMTRWVKSNSSCNLIFGVYELGKAQEVIRILNLCGVAPIVSEKADRFCQVYGDYGIKLDRLVVGTDEAESVMTNGSFVSLVSMRISNKNFAKRIEEAFSRRTLCATVTGWALRYNYNVHATFALSDHADFNDLVSYAEQTGAKNVEFFCGDGKSVLDRLKL